MARVLRLLPLLFLLLAPGLSAQSITYEARLTPTGDAALDGALADASRLLRLREEAPVDPLGLVARAAADPPRLEEVLRSEGYWAGRVEALVAGEPAIAPGLAERLPTEGGIAVELRVIPGPRYSLRRIAVQPAGIAPPPGLAAGDPARAAPVLDAETALIDRLRAEGHPLASIEDREVLVDHEALAMDVTWQVAPGPRAAFARPEIDGETRVSRALIGRIANRLAGETYSPERLDAARRELLRLGAFDSVRARAARRLDEEGHLPVTFTLTDRPRNAAGFNIAYETNFGPTGRVYYERRNVFGNAETLRVEAETSRLGAGGGTADINYRIGASLRRPGLLGGRTTLLAEAQALRERLEAYDRDAIVLSLLAERPIGERWVVGAGPIFETGRIGRDGDLSPFTLLGLVTTLRYDGTDNPLDATRGIRANLNITPYADLAEGGGFTRALGSLRTYFDVSGDGGTVIALRGTVGSLVGAGRREVPFDKRFYAGGGGSVRGYAYQGIGPRDARRRPEGGASLVEGSVEIRQRVRGAIGMVAFLDAGSVGERETPSVSDVRLGAGLGVRYATAIGPVRFDVAIPLERRSGDPAYGLYVGLGQAF